MPLPMQRDESRPVRPVPIPETDIFETCKAFVLRYALPALEPENVLQGWQDEPFSVPESTGDMAVISIVSGTRRGTVVETFIADDSDPNVPGILHVQGLLELAVRVDFYADDDTARQRAQRLAVVTRSSIGVQFFNDRGMSALYADPIKTTTGGDDIDPFACRYSVVLLLSCWSGDSVEMEYFSRAEMDRVENVDTHHPIIEE